MIDEMSSPSRNRYCFQYSSNFEVPSLGISLDRTAIIYDAETVAVT